MSERRTLPLAGSVSPVRSHVIRMGHVALLAVAALAVEAALARTIVVPPPAMPEYADMLGAGKAETLYGWRNGRYFAESVTGGDRVESAATDAASVRVFAVNFRLSKGRGLRHFTTTNEVGVAVLPALSADAQKWLYRPDWNMMRVTRRGPGVPAEWFSCDISSHFFYIKLR